MAKKRVHRPEGFQPVQRSMRTSAKPRPGATEPARRSLRDRIEDASRASLQRMHMQPAWFLPVTLSVTLFLGLVLSSAWSGILLILIAGFLSWLTAVSWPTLGEGSRVLRIVVDVAVLGLGVAKLLGRF